MAAPDTAVPSVVSLSEAEVSALLDCHRNWDTAARIRSTVLVEHLQSVMSSGKDVLPSISKQDLRDRQREDTDLARVMFYVERHHRPSRRDRPSKDL